MTNVDTLKDVVEVNVGTAEDDQEVVVDQDRGGDHLNLNLMLQVQRRLRLFWRGQRRFEKRV